ncbi:hypothetical protein HMPREF9374_2588 [Desmospora sp. 8437]|uniref:Lipoprotein n=1 Tax=Kroppenstedtia guangzhouensis TaxID=1274356 RepID=A0ABQ1GNX1_9BACL|nr:hypothetical protein [Kroppenstedtia guangzhouensis]EGK10238.1 hypothetical protein HMPREF9374_2588 [Desmospora sp. 8437]GGA47169.1 hypothetical protein GCM10007416_20450 [Kroppenstedtia guangzhouensis]
MRSHRLKWLGGVLAVLLVAAGCSGQASTQEQPEEPKGPGLTPGERAAIEFYKAKYVDGDEKRAQKLAGKDRTGIVRKSTNGPIEIQPMKGETLTESRGTYYIRMPDQTYIRVEVYKEDGEWSVFDHESINQIEINQFADEDSWKRVERP